MILLIFIEARADSSKVKGKVYRVHQMNNLETTTNINGRTLYAVKNKKSHIANHLLQEKEESYFLSFYPLMPYQFKTVV